MWASFAWGTLAASTLVIGAVLAIVFRIGLRWIGMIMAFGAGVLISAVAFDLVEEASNSATADWPVYIGMFAGCGVYFGGDWLISRSGGGKRKDPTGAQKDGSALAIVLAGPAEAGPRWDPEPKVPAWKRMVPALGAYLALVVPVALLDRHAFMARTLEPHVIGPGLGLFNLLSYRGLDPTVLASLLAAVSPLLAVLVLVETSDVLFALDSIPAVFGVTSDPFIVYTSNIFAILGLRSLYFALAGVMDKFHYLKIGLGVVLTFVGVKMLLAHTAWKLDTLVSLGVIVVILATSVVLSLVQPRKIKLPVAADVSPLNPKLEKSEPTHVGCYHSKGSSSGAHGVARPT